MQTYFKYFGVIILILFSFFYTEKTINVINMQDDIMIKITQEENNYKIESSNAIIKDDFIIPGINGQKVNVSKSYKNMKKVGLYDDSLYIYDKIIPKISINNNYNKYIISGNSKYNNISLIFKVNNDNEYEQVLDIIKNNNIKINIFIDYEYLASNISNINKNDRYNYYSYGNNSVYTNDILIISNNIINRKSNKALYCLNENLNKKYMEVCAGQKTYSIYPSIINANYHSIKDNIKNGSIISFGSNTNGIKEIKTIINYIISKGYNIVLLDELLSEDIKSTK